MSIDALIFVGYLIVLSIVGFVTAKWMKTADEYIVAGRRLKLWLAFSTVAATWIGGGITIGVAGKAYAGKAIGLWGTTIGFGTTLILVGLFYAGPLRRLRLYTLADYFSERFNKKWLGGLSGIIMFVAYVFAVTAQIVAGAKLLETVFGWDYVYGVIVSGGIIVLYTVLGGLWAVSLTDFVQISITFVGVLVTLGMTMAIIGPDQISIKLSETGLFDPKFILAFDFWALFLVLGLGDIPAPDLMQRVFASKDVKTAKLSAILGGISYYFVGVISAIIGVSAAILLPNLSDPQLAYPMMIKMVLPAGVAGLVLSGLMAAVMSNADSMLLAPASVIAKNIFKDLIKPGASDRELLMVSRAVVLVLGIAAIVTALPKPDILYWLTLAFDVLFASLFFPLTLGLYWKRLNWQGAAAGIIGGAIARMILEYALNAGVLPEWWIASLGAPAISAILTIALSLVTAPPGQKELEAFNKARAKMVGTTQ